MILDFGLTAQRPHPKSKSKIKPMLENELMKLTMRHKNPKSGYPLGDRVPSRRRKPVPGQAAVIIALSLLLLIAIVGLAIDGGSMYNQRRVAQNSADAAAMATTRAMLDMYEEMIFTYPYDEDGTEEQDDAPNAILREYLASHGVQRDDVQAYYVTDAKQVT